MVLNCNTGSRKIKASKIKASKIKARMMKNKEPNLFDSAVVITLWRHCVNVTKKSGFIFKPHSRMLVDTRHDAVL